MCARMFACRRRLGAHQQWVSPTVALSLSLHLHSFAHCSSLCSKHLALPDSRCSTLNTWAGLLSLRLVHLKTSGASPRLPLCQRSAAWGANNRTAAQIPKHCRDRGKAHTDTHTHTKRNWNPSNRDSVIFIRKSRKQSKQSVPDKSSYEYGYLDKCPDKVPHCWRTASTL